MSALMAILLLALGQLPVAQVSTEFDAPPFIVVGLIVGVAALFGVSNYGTKGILAPALVGIAINCLLLSNLVTNFIAARAKAQRAETPSQSTLVWLVTNLGSVAFSRHTNRLFPRLQNSRRQILMSSTTTLPFYADAGGKFGTIAGKGSFLAPSVVTWLK